MRLSSVALLIGLLPLVPPAKHAPWYVVPADNKWFTRLIVAAAIIDALGSLDLKFPEVDDAKKAKLAAARAALEQE